MTSLLHPSPFDSEGPHPDLLAFARGPLATFNAAVTASMFHPVDLHPGIAELDAANGRKFAIVADWVRKQVRNGWPLETVLDEANRRIRLAERPNGGGR